MPVVPVYLPDKVLLQLTELAPVSKSVLVYIAEVLEAYVESETAVADGDGLVVEQLVAEGGVASGGQLE